MTYSPTVDERLTESSLGATGAAIHWSVFEHGWVGFFSLILRLRPDPLGGWTAVSTTHFALSDEAVVWGWVKNPTGNCSVAKPGSSTSHR